MNRYYQGGGQEGSQEQMQMIMQKVAQMLQQGTQPQQVLSQLVEAGIPQDQAVQLVQGVMQQMQGSQETQGGQEMPQEQFGYGGMRTYQGGAQMPQEQMELPQEVIQILQMFAQMQGMNQEQFQQLVQKFMELSPDEQKDALTQIAQVMQQEEAEGPQQQMAQQPQQMAQEQMPQEQPQQPVMEGGGRFMTPSEMTKSMSLFNSPADMAQGTQERGVPSMMTMSVSGNPFSKTSLKKYQTGKYTEEEKQQIEEGLEMPTNTASNQTNKSQTDTTPVNNQLTFNINDFSKVKTNIERIKSLQNDLREMADFDESVKSSPVYKAFVKTSFKKNGESDGVWGKNTQALYQLLQSKTKDKDSNISNFVNDFKTIKQEANKAVKGLRKVQIPVTQNITNSASDNTLYQGSELPEIELPEVVVTPNKVSISDTNTPIKIWKTPEGLLEKQEAVRNENNRIKQELLANAKELDVKDVLGNSWFGGSYNHITGNDKRYKLVQLPNGNVMRKYFSDKRIDVPSEEDMMMYKDYLKSNKNR